MKYLTWTALILLACTTAGLAAYAWRQNQRLAILQVELDAARARSTPFTERSDAPEPGAIPANDAGEVVAAEAVAEAANPEIMARSARPGGPPVRLNELMEDPAFAAAWNTQQRARLDGRYAALFRKLNLPAEAIERFKSLLADRQSAQADVISAAREQGLTGRESRDEIQALVAQAQGEIDAQIRALIGDGGFQTYQQFERTAPQRAMVGQLESRLSYSGVPLTAPQAEALVGLLSQATVNPGSGGRPAQRTGPISDAVIARAQGILAPAQVEALRQLQAEHEAQVQLNQMMRERAQRNRARPAPAPQG